MPDFAESLRESIPVVMRALAQAQNSGILRVRGKDAEAELMFFKGQVLWARHSDGKRLGEALEERGAITAEQIEGVLRVQKRKKTKQPIATILVELGLVDADVITTELDIQVLEVIRAMFSWGAGEYAFEAVEGDPDAGPGFTMATERTVEEILRDLGVS